MEQCREAGVALQQSAFTSYLEYVEHFSEFVRQKIEAAHAEGRFDYDPSPLSPPGQENLIVRLFFCGYFAEQPFACDVKMNCENGELECEAFQYAVNNMAPAVLGSQRIAELMYVERDWRFRNYTVRITASSTLQEGVECVRGYLRACSTPLARPRPFLRNHRRPYPYCRYHF